VRPPATNPIVHLELCTGNLPRACSFYTQLFGWQAETVHLGTRTYLSLGLGERIEGGVAECDLERPLWLPYVEVADVTGVAERARRLGGRVLLEPREGPVGWRSIVSVPAGAEIALWQAKSSHPT
jgi:predicted enzyme related to lactoylglutathione lyase